jgi:hypothetical protein
MSRKSSDKKPPKTSTRVPIDVFGSDDEHDDEYSGASGASGAPQFDFDFEVTGKPMSSKKQRAATKAAAEAAAKAGAEAAQQELKDAAKRRQQLYEQFPWMAPNQPRPPRLPSITCEICHAEKPEGAIDWKESTLGFSSQGICPKCAPMAKPLNRNPTLVWDFTKPDEFSHRRMKKGGTRRKSKSKSKSKSRTKSKSKSKSRF